MEDFVLTLQPLPDYHLVNAECRLVGQIAPHQISLKDRQELEKLGERLQTRPPQEIAEVVVAGQKLFRHLFGGEIAGYFRRALEEANDDGGLRVLLRFDKGDRLQDLPWELLHDGSWPLALNPATAIARYIAGPWPVRVPRFNSPIRVLFTAACPPGTQKLDFETEQRKLRDHFRSFDNVELEIESKITLRRLEHLLSHAENGKKPFHIWHHAGHGSLDTHSNFHLCLEGSERERHASIAEISRILTACPNLLAVVLNVCHGAALATAVACENLPVAIGFREQILDRTALTFAQSFYGNILRYPLEVALTRSRLALAYQGYPLLNWTKPLLYTRTTRPVILRGRRDGRLSRRA